jgi:hypothetical protein
MRVAGILRKRLWIGPLTPADHGGLTIKILAALSAVILIFVAAPAKERSNPFAWDLLLLSGFATFLAGLLATRSSKDKFETMLDRLGRRGVISEIDRVKTDMEQMAERWTQSVATGVAISVLGAFIAVMISDPEHAGRRTGLCLFETAWAYGGRMSDWTFGCIRETWFVPESFEHLAACIPRSY